MPVPCGYNECNFNEFCKCHNCAPDSPLCECRGWTPRYGAQVFTYKGDKKADKPRTELCWKCAALIGTFGFLCGIIISKLQGV